MSNFSRALKVRAPIISKGKKRIIVTYKLLYNRIVLAISFGFINMLKRTEQTKAIVILIPAFSKNFMKEKVAYIPAKNIKRIIYFRIIILYPWSVFIPHFSIKDTAEIRLVRKIVSAIGSSLFFSM